MKPSPTSMSPHAALAFLHRVIPRLGMLGLATGVGTTLIFAANPCLADSTADPTSESAAESDSATEDDSNDAPAWDIENPPGPSQTQSIDCDAGTWISLDVSPDGQTIAFDLLGDIYTMPITGADGTDATDGRSPINRTQSVAWDMQPRFSPDGNSLAFTSDRSGENDKSGDNLWFMPLTGNAKDAPQDSDDVEADTNQATAGYANATQVTTEDFRLLNGPAWSPDGQYLIGRKHFTSRRSLGSGECWMYHIDAVATKSTGGVQLTEKQTLQKDVNEFVYSPDGKSIYYSQDVSPGEQFEYDKDSHKGIYAIKRLNLIDGETETLIRGPGGACRPTPSPDGKTLAFVRRVGAKTGLHLFDLESGRIELLTDQLERDMQESWAIHGVYPTFAWTPDSASLVYYAQGKIHRIDVADKQSKIIPFRIRDQRQIRTAVRHAVDVAPAKFPVRMLTGVAVSPSGDRVAYAALGHLYLKDLPDGEPARLTDQSEHFEMSPAWSADGQSIAYTTWNDARLGSVRVKSLDDSAAPGHVVTDHPGHYQSPAFSPDGKTIVFEKRGGGLIRSSLHSRHGGIYTVAADGGTPTHVIDDGTEPQFSADGSRILLSQRSADDESDHVRLVSVDLAGHDQRSHYHSDWATDLRVSADGRRLAIVERYHVLVTPFVDAGGEIKIGPDAKGLPTIRVSEEAGTNVQFSGDGQRMHWSLGPTLYTRDIPSRARDIQAKTETVTTPIGFDQLHARPDDDVVTAIVGGRVLTMAGTDSEIGDELTDAVVIIRGDRIQDVGPRDQLMDSIPDDARVIDAQGQIVMPGLIDTHAHGAMATFGIVPQHNWIDYARLAFGVTTVHDPSNDTAAIFTASEMAKAGQIVSPRTFSTGTILYGATGSFAAKVNSIEEARFHLRRMKAVGAFSVKSYNQPRRDQRQMIVAAGRELDMMIVPEGGSTFMHNMTMIVDGHTGIEHTLPVQTAYDDVRDLWRNSGVGYTPTLNVAYGGLSGERYWYNVDDLWTHGRLQSFIPPHVLNPRSRRREKAPLEDYNHIKVAEIARDRVDDGGLVQAGGHGQLPGLGTHWEMWSFVQGGMQPIDALRCGTLHGAKYLGLDGDLGSIQPGKLADILILRSDADPTIDIRDSEAVETVIAGGYVYNADRMNRYGDPAPRPDFYWVRDGNTGSVDAACTVTGCSCHR